MADAAPGPQPSPHAGRYELAAGPDGLAPLPAPWAGRSVEIAWRCRDCPPPMRPVYVLDDRGSMACDWHCGFGAFGPPARILGRVELDTLRVEVFAEPLYLAGESGQAKRVVPPREATRPRGRHLQHELIVDYPLHEAAYAREHGLPSIFAPAAARGLGRGRRHATGPRLWA